MTEIAIYWTAVVTILSIAFPILFQTYSRLDEKYESDYIVELFNAESAKNYFTNSLYVSLIACVILSLNQSPWFYTGNILFDTLLENSASILLAITAINMVVSFFKYVYLMNIYNIPSKLIKKLISNHNESVNDFKYFEALVDIFILSIKRQNTNNKKSLSKFFYIAFQKEREKSIDVPVEYPAIYYELVKKSLEELAITKERRDYALEHRISGSIWLLGELRSGEISDRTYYYLWQNMLLAIQYNNDDMILNHWQTAHQHIKFSLQRIYKEYGNVGDNHIVINENQVEKRNSERNKFLKFHYALGGLLMYYKKYDCINRCHNYTTSSPPDYELLPSSMYEIFMFYHSINDPYGHSNFGVFSEYHFPEIEGMNSDAIKQKWVTKYLSLLFLRQYKIHPYLITMRPLEIPSIKLEQSDMRMLIGSLDFFKSLIEETINDYVILKSFKLDFITQEWCKDNSKVYPLDLMDQIKAHLEKSYNSSIANATLDNVKIQQFYDSSSPIVEDAITSYSSINNIIDTEETDKLYISGIKMLYSKDAFVETPEATYFDFDTFTAEQTSIKIKEGVATAFLHKITVTYLIKREDTFKAIEKLNINTDYVIICFGFYINNFLKQFKADGLSLSSYKGIPIYEFESYGVIKSSVFVIKKTDLPEITTNSLSKEVIDEYSLINIGKVHKVYSSILNLNTAAESVRANLNFNEDEIGTSVILNILFNLEVKWKRKAEVIQLNIYNSYEQQGILNELSEIKLIIE